MRRWKDVKKEAKGGPGSDAWNPAAVARAVLKRFPSAVAIAYRVGTGLGCDVVVRFPSTYKRTIHVSF